eukprot:CAMPEP_0119129530 /NCGR_PEP_ID=MMETSP1310-20130426/7234_1 /TAXON_ID=464262 /ORGANISM="Genus nov. species nov., Strain RCC2339" /LENGTH=367 /DNA_ID=CAMNT_0007119955 /DNA_START=294 /DNA_END=1394 /DNA_ORIENTATION=-
MSEPEHPRSKKFGLKARGDTTPSVTVGGSGSGLSGSPLGKSRGRSASSGSSQQKEGGDGGDRVVNSLSLSTSSTISPSSSVSKKLSKEEFDLMVDELMSRIAFLIRRERLFDKKIEMLEDATDRTADDKHSEFRDSVILQKLRTERENIELDLIKRRRELLDVYRELRRKVLKSRAFGFSKREEHQLCWAVPLHAIKTTPPGGYHIDIHCCAQDFLRVDEKKTFGEFIAGQTLSTYPTFNGVRQGDPICDRFWVRMQRNRFIVALSDGCNWGWNPATAAHTAVNAFMRYFREVDHNLVDAKKAARYTLRAFSRAHREIVEGARDIWTAGTATLMGGILMEMDPMVILEEKKRIGDGEGREKKKKKPV